MLASLLVILCARTTWIQASPTLMATPGLIGAFGFEDSATVTDSSDLSDYCTGHLGSGQFALPSKQCVYGSCMKMEDSWFFCARSRGGLTIQAYTVAAWLLPSVSRYVDATMLFFEVYDYILRAVDFGITSSGNNWPNTSLNVPQVTDDKTIHSYVNGSSYAFPFMECLPVNSTGNSSANSTGNLCVNSTRNWAHVAFVFNGANVRIYITSECLYCAYQFLQYSLRRVIFFLSLEVLVTITHPRTSFHSVA